MTTDDPQSTAEALDEDKVDDREDYHGDRSGVGFPPERPMGSGRQTLTPTDEAFGESVAERDRRENPDPLAEELDRAGRSAPSERQGVGAADEDEDPRAVGQLVEPDDHDVNFPDSEAELVADREAPAADQPAEEAAMHLLPEDAAE
jgi:hypothetical protein